MDDIIASIRAYVLILDPDITEDDFLTFVINEVVDRTLLYTNRQQLVAQYELDIVDTSVDEDDYVVPIPEDLQRPLARVVLNSYKTTRANVDEPSKEISSISDNGQSVTYSDSLESYFSSTDDMNIFSSIKMALDRYRIPNIVENNNYTVRVPNV